ncbi:MAG: glutamate-5-semialdehyde dehydrogenase, partial [Leptodesmis sp.]
MTISPVVAPDSASLSPLVELAKRTCASALQLGTTPTEMRNQALEAIAQSLEAAAPEILAANQADCQTAQEEGLASALYARLKLDETKLRGAIAGVRDVAKLPDPIGVVQIHRELDTELVLKRVTCPLGVLGVIFEARPDAVVQISSLAIKSGNGVILKGGKEAIRS